MGVGELAPDPIHFYGDTQVRGRKSGHYKILLQLLSFLQPQKCTIFISLETSKLMDAQRSGIMT